MNISPVSLFKSSLTNYSSNYQINKNTFFKGNLDKDKFEYTALPLKNCESIEFKGFIKRANREQRDVFVLSDSYKITPESMVDLEGCLIDMKNPKIANLLKNMKKGNKIYFVYDVQDGKETSVGTNAFSEKISVTDKDVDAYNIKKFKNDPCSKRFIKLASIEKSLSGDFIYTDNSYFGSLINPSDLLGKSKKDKSEEYRLTSAQKKNYLNECKTLGINPKSDEYAGFTINSIATKGKYWTNSSKSIFWSSSNVYSEQKCSWKMHLYSVDTNDYIKMAEIVLPYLNKNGIEHKCMSRWRSPEDLKGIQNGKAFTIYPKSIQEMERVAKDLDFLIRYHGLTKEDTNIQGDRQLGATGRLFYRYELDSGKYAFDSFSSDEFYDKHYDRNRANKDLEYPHLPSDMCIEDDIWLNFNPSDSKSHPAKKIKPAVLSSKIKLKKGEQIEFDPENTKIYLASLGDEGYYLDMSSSDILKMLKSMKQNEAITIGRKPNCNISIPDNYDKVSRSHGYIKKHYGKYVYTDTSMNGTYLVAKKN